MTGRNPAPSEPDPRVLFAAERTFLAWIRTGLALMGFGFVVARFGLFLREVAALSGRTTERHFSDAFGIGLVILGIAVTGGSVSLHVANVRRLRRGEVFEARVSWLGIGVGVVLACVGLVMVWYLIAVD